MVDARVIQTLAIYIPVAWVFTEIVTAATANFGLPAWLPGLAMVLLISGIPVVAFLAWAFQITADGVRTEVVSVKGGLFVAVALAVLLGIGTTLFQRLETAAPDISAYRSGGQGPVGTQPVTSVSVFAFEGPGDGSLGEIFSSEISDRLARHADLLVSAPEAVQSVQLASFGPAERQELLLTEHAVRGRIRQEDEAYRLEVELVDAQGQTLWQEEFGFGADLESQRGLQRRLGLQLAERLGVRSVAAEYCEPTGNIEALESYHAARLLLNRKGPDNLAEAERLLKRAIELDPEYGRAYSALAITYLLQRKPGGGELAADLSRKALDHCATLGAAYKIWVPAYEGIDNFFVDQELQWQDALAMEPNHLWLLDNYANWLEQLGRRDEVREITERAYRNNPLEPRAVVSHGWSLLGAEEYESARRLANRAKELGDESCNAEMLLLAVATETGDSAAAIEAAYGNVPQRCKDAMLLGWENFDMNDIAGARTDPAKRRKMLDFVEAGLEENPNRAFIWGLQLGDADLAHRAAQFGQANGHYIHRPLMWAHWEGARMFRRDPRFAEMVEDAGLVDYWREFGWPSGGMCAPFGEGFVCDN
jgi:Tfp pilus assembly protein PilF/TolB-like protein